MITYSCDGKQFFGGYKCHKKETNEVPKNWLIIDVNYIENKLGNKRLNSMGGGILHFCSKECLNNYLFKNMPDFEELRVYYSIFKSGIKTENPDIKEKELKSRFAEYVKNLTHYDAMVKYDNELKESLNCL